MTEHPPIVADALTVHGTLYPDEYAALIEHWSKLDHRLRSFDRHHIGLDLHVHDRDTPSQRVTLEATISGFAPFIAKDDHRDLQTSLNHVRDEMIRQLSDAKNKTEPRNNRQLRRSARRSSPDA